MTSEEYALLWRLWGQAWRKRLDSQAAMRPAIDNPCDSKNTGFMASKRQGGRQ